MGTYTANYQLYMPTVGEQGWGDLMNGNLTTIDTTMKSLSNRITTCESYGARITAIENEVNGALSCTSVTASGKITGNGGIAGTTGTFSGAVTGTSFNGATITSTKFNGVLLKQTITVTPTSTFVDSYTDIMTYLSCIPGVTYSGSIQYKNANSNKAYSIKIMTGDTSQGIYNSGLGAGAGTQTFSFSNVPCLLIVTGSTNIKIATFTLS